jgi:threonylcarbamoyladenosine tRNA methylthiotransferase MtaB
MKTTFYSFSFGCRVNQAEKEELDRQLVNRGYEFNSINPALYIINTCSVTHKAEREARQLIYQTKKKYPETKIIVTGCAATNWIKTNTTLHEVEMIIDNKQKEYLAELIDKRLGKDLSTHSTSDSQHVYTQPLINDKYLASKRIIIKIQDGCQRFCSFCIVPYLRGLPRSTSIQQIVEKVKSFPDMQEVILTAINTEAYGYDTKEPFIDLLKAVIDQTSVPRISFGSIHPWSINEEFFEFYKTYVDKKRLVNFFHIPLQSGCDKMLQIMKRGYTRAEFMEKLQKIADINPFAFIGTDVIVGFLDENEKDFTDTYEFLEKTPISKFHIFRFSKRQHTAAYYLSKRLPEPTPQEKQKRAKALADLNTKKYQQFLDKHVNNTFTTLFLEKREESLQHGLLDNQIPVLVETEKDLTGEIKPVTILRCKNGQLFGKIDT